MVWNRIKDYQSRVTSITDSEKDDMENGCKKCIDDFSAAGGCECLKNKDCSAINLIPEGCFMCDNKIMEFCNSKTGYLNL